MERIRTLRKEKHMSQLSLALEIGVTQNTISAYECGSRMPDIATIARLAEFFHCSVDYLLGRTEIKTPVDELVIDNLTAREIEILAMLRKLSTYDLGKAAGFIESLLEHKE